MRNLHAASLFAFLVFAGDSDAADAQIQTTTKKMSAADQAARVDACELESKHQTRNCQSTCVVQVPEAASGLPTEYDLVMYYGWYALGVIRIQCRETDTAGELVTTREFRRGKLPWAEVDHLTRQFLYLYRAQVRRRDGSETRDYLYAGYASPAPFITIEVRSVAGQLLLKTETVQWYARSITQREGVKPFAVAWFAERIQALCRQQLQNQIERREVVAELLARLKEMQPGRQDLSDPTRHDRLSYEADAYAKLLLMRKESNALPQFCRLGLTAYARQLEVALAEDPATLFREILANEKDELWHWARTNVHSHLNPEAHRDVLIFALNRCGKPILQRVLIGEVRKLPASAHARRAIRDIFDRQEVDREVRVAAAAYLLAETREDRYFSYLSQEALTPRKDLNRSDDPTSAAIDALIEFATQKKERRQQVADIARTLLKRIPRDSHPTFSQLGQLVGYLGRAGGPADARLLQKYCEQSSVRAEAVYALAQFDPALALKFARQHVASLVASESGKSAPRYPNVYLNCVSYYSDLFIAYGDRKVIDLYEEFLAHIAAHTEPGYELTYYRDRTTSVLGVLRAENARDELDRAVKHVRTLGPSSYVLGPEYDNLLEALAERLDAAAGSKERARERLDKAHRIWRDRIEASANQAALPP